MNRSSQIFWQERAYLKEAIKGFFDARAYFEVETPAMVNVPGTETHLDYFATSWTFHKHQNTRYLRSSPELSLKELLSDDLPRLYEIARCFRNGAEIGPWHNPEFTMLEFYQVRTCFVDFMNLTQEFFESTAKFMETRGANFSSARLKGQWQRIRVADAFEEFAHLSLVDRDPDLAAKACEKNYVSVQKTDDFETAYFKILIDLVEPALKKMGAVILYDFPPSQAALAKVEDGWAKRFECYIQGIELCNAFEELTGFSENQIRLRQTERHRADLGKSNPLACDADIQKWSQFPEACGNAVGFDRWLAVLMGQSSLDRCLIRNFSTT